MTVKRHVALLFALAVLVAACQGSGTDATTTTEATRLSLPEPTPTSTTAPTTTTIASFDPLTPPEYQIVSRTEVEGAPGDEVVILLDPTTYDTLTDIDIEDLLAEVIELFPPIWIAHVIDDPAAANVVTNPAASEAERTAIESNYYAVLTNGFEITFLGPLAESGGGVIGS